MNATAQFQDRLNQVAKDTEALLDRLLGTGAGRRRSAGPPGCSTPCAMRASAPASGSGRSWWWRARPCSASPRKHALMAGAALECVHCYSLVHDDLPAMDNDDLRRGQPTVHKAFDDATAILAGDGLLTLAFDILARAETHPDPAVRVELVRRWRARPASAAWSAARCSTSPPKGRFDGGTAQRLARARSLTLQAMKTGALLQVRLPRGRHSRQGRRGAARGARPLRRGGRAGVPDRRRSARRRGRSGAGRQADRQGRGRRQGDHRRHSRRRWRQGAAADHRQRSRGGARAVRLSLPMC